MYPSFDTIVFLVDTKHALLRTRAKWLSYRGLLLFADIFGSTRSPHRVAPLEHSVFAMLCELRLDLRKNSRP
jgi:hypothetical protein